MKRRRLIVSLAAVVVLGLLTAAVFYNREPRYQGRSLSEWLYSYQNSEPLDPERETAEDAVKHMARDAIPWLLKWAEASDSSLISKVRLWLARRPILHYQTHRSDYYHNKAFAGFKILKHEAKAALPALIQMTYSHDFETKTGALGALINIQPDRDVFLPVLLRLVKDTDTVIRIQASWILYNNYPRDAKAAGILVPFRQPSMQQRPGSR